MRKGEKTADLELKEKLAWGSKQFGAAAEEPSCWENKISGAKEMILGQRKSVQNHSASKEHPEKQESIPLAPRAASNGDAQTRERLFPSRRWSLSISYFRGNSGLGCSIPGDWQCLDGVLEPSPSV